MSLYYTYSLDNAMDSSVFFVFSLRGIFAMRKLFIKKSLEHAPGYPISFHTARVRLMEAEWISLIKKATVTVADSNKEERHEYFKSTR